ncbi:alpha/beta hydrolase family esterase [Paractinoplanes atraurantiacus]|uniref:Polyhydroxybutyrate depolymerase n=1 Tax=Paractinoplanes atraurantiacus TaxID=1036182 RepID=A0A285JGQ3_9ACTN|nr:alpha/beta fold hydrolase [Actinoplanes atraurantiacus]SNY59458.1 polyhydroxybutyrate depolymerase [Actinoplanes atraurantiacus]
MARRGRQTLRAMVAATAVMVMVACGSDETPSPPAGSPAAMPASGTGTVEVGGRRVTVHVPASYDPGRPAPLVVGLHGYSSDAGELESYLGLTAQSDKRTFVYAYPDGSADDRGDQFWNATDACCAFYGKPDDSRYLSELIATLRRSYGIDGARVYLIGHSNGGFMAFRMACDHADQVTAIVSLNGASWNDAGRCRPSQPVSVLAIHSSTDETVAFGGGDINGIAYPSAATTVTQWQGYDQCAGAGRDAPALDLVTDLPGAETAVRSYTQGCAGGATVEAWTINGGSHVPQLGPAFTPAVTDFLLSRTKAAR